MHWCVASHHHNWPLMWLASSASFVDLDNVTCQPLPTGLYLLIKDPKPRALRAYEVIISLTPICTLGTGPVGI
jgi:hypothetical protein